MADSNPPFPASPSSSMALLKSVSSRHKIVVRNDAEDTLAFTSALAEALPEPVAAQYAAALVMHAISPDTPPELNEAQMAELGIRIGHREMFKAIMHELRRSTGDLADVTLSDVTDVDAVDIKKESEIDLIEEAAVSTLKREALVFANASEWIDYQGEHRTCQAFLETMRAMLASAHLPSSFLRLFFNNKPLPFGLYHAAPGGRMATGVLLRVPLADILPMDREGPTGLTSQEITLHKLTNRLVLIFVPGLGHRRAQLITFRRDTNVKEIQDLKEKWNGTHAAEQLSLEAVAVRVLRESIEVFRDVLSALQLEVEVCSALPDSYRPKEVVKTLSRVQRQAAVMRRCLAGNDKVLHELIEKNTLGDELSAVRMLVQDLKEVSDELEGNASQMLDLRLAMIDFKTQMNMKLFTYMTIVISPLGLITGWFGMNFEEMEELKVHGFYYGVVAFAISLMVFLGTMLVWMNRDRRVTHEDAADAEVVLSKASLAAD